MPHYVHFSKRNVNSSSVKPAKECIHLFHFIQSHMLSKPNQGSSKSYAKVVTKPGSTYSDHFTCVYYVHHQWVYMEERNESLKLKQFHVCLLVNLEGSCFIHLFDIHEENLHLHSCESQPGSARDTLSCHTVKTG